MNVDRLCGNGGVDPNENHKSQIFVTTAGYKNSFAYDKMIQLIIWMIVKGNAFVFGGDWKVPVMHGLLNADFVRELKEDGTYNEMTFSSEYESIWAGTPQDAFFETELFDRQRKLHEAEYDWKKGDYETFYVMGIDVARLTAQTVVQIVKVIKRPNGYYKQLVNTFVYENRHFLYQSIDIKKKVRRYNISQIAVDINGLGAGLLDFLIIENTDEFTQEVFPAYSVTNLRDYDNMQREGHIPLIFAIRPNDDLNSQMYVNYLSQFNSAKVRLLVDEKVAKIRLLNTKAGRAMSAEEKASYLAPYIYTSLLKQEMMNLRQKVDNKGGSKLLRLEEVRRRGKDKFSAFVYALWYIRLVEEDHIQKKKKAKATDFMFYN